MKSFSPEFETHVDWTPPTGQEWRNLDFNSPKSNTGALKIKAAADPPVDELAEQTIMELGFNPVMEEIPDVEKLWPGESPGSDLTAEFVSEHEEVNLIHETGIATIFGVLYSSPDFPTDEELAQAREGIGVTRGYGFFELEGIIDRSNT